MMTSTLHSLDIPFDHLTVSTLRTLASQGTAEHHQYIQASHPAAYMISCLYAINAVYVGCCWPMYTGQLHMPSFHQDL